MKSFTGYLLAVCAGYILCMFQAASWKDFGAAWLGYAALIVAIVLGIIGICACIVGGWADEATEEPRVASEGKTREAL